MVKRVIAATEKVPSMRPPHYAGENDGGAGPTAVAVEPSMRPPHYAGENPAGAKGYPVSVEFLQ